MFIQSVEHCSQNQNFSKNPVGFIFEGERPSIYYVLNNTNPILARKTKIGLIEWSKKRERNELNKNPSPFFFTQLIAENQNNEKKYYFDNTCENASLNKLDSYSQMSWKITKFKNNIAPAGGFTRSGERLHERIEHFTKEQIQNIKDHRLNVFLMKNDWYCPDVRLGNVNCIRL